MAKRNKEEIEIDAKTTEDAVIEESDKAALDYMKKTAVTMTKDTLKTWMELGETFAALIEKRARKMGFEDPAEYLRSALDFFDAYRDRVNSFEIEIEKLRGEVALLSHLRPKILKAWSIAEYKKMRNLYLYGIISEEAFLRSLELIKKIGDEHGR